MKAYVAAPFYRKDEVRQVIKDLACLGVESTARWVDSHNSDYDAKPEVLKTEAAEDLYDIERADTFILLAHWPKEGSGGKDVEFGYALGRGKKMVVVGEPYNLFHQRSEVAVVSKVEDIRW